MKHKDVEFKLLCPKGEPPCLKPLYVTIDCEDGRVSTDGVCGHEDDQEVKDAVTHEIDYRQDMERDLAYGRE